MKMPSGILSSDSKKISHICVWSDFSLKQIDELISIEDVQLIKRKFAEILNLADHLDNKKSMILVDLFYFAFVFARGCKFSEEQISALLSIIKRTHEKAMETPFGNVDATFEYFKELILRHSVKRPPFSIQLYDVNEAKKVTDYIVDTYFRHFKLYKYAFTPTIKLNLTIDYLGLPETPQQTSDQEEIADELEETESKVDEMLTNPRNDVEEVEDPPAVQELKTLINTTLTEQVQKLRSSVDQQLKSNEELIMKKVSSISGSERASSRKTSRKK